MEQPDFRQEAKKKRPSLNYPRTNIAAHTSSNINHEVEASGTIENVNAKIQDEGRIAPELQCLIEDKFFIIARSRHLEYGFVSPKTLESDIRRRVPFLIIAFQREERDGYLESEQM